MELGKIIWEQPHLMSKILYEFGGLITPSAIAFKKDCVISDNFYNEEADHSYLERPAGYIFFQTVISFNEKRFRVTNMVVEERVLDDEEENGFFIDREYIEEVWNEYQEERVYQWEVKKILGYPTDEDEAYFLSKGYVL